MRFHVVQVGEDKDKICQLYALDSETFSKLNPSIGERKLKVGEKIRVLEKRSNNEIVDNINKIYTENTNQVYDNYDEKYICPHCKNIILIPRSLKK